MSKEFYISKDSKYVFVSDFFVEDLVGGAELTLEALANSSEEKVFKIHSYSLTERLIKDNVDKHWILVNYTSADMVALGELVRSKCKFSIIECDYKFCKYRSVDLHKIKENTECDCHKKKWGKFAAALMARAKNVFFMSEFQMNFYKERFPSLEKINKNLFVQTSTWSNEHLNNLIKLQKIHEKKNGKWAVLKGGSWIKAEQQTVQYCKQNNISYELVGGLPYNQFIEKLAEYSGLVFLPAGGDTCPRIVIEAKLLGLKLILNQNVQHKDEVWFTSTKEDCEKYLRTRTDYFWNKF